MNMNIKISLTVYFIQPAIQLLSTIFVVKISGLSTGFQNRQILVFKNLDFNSF